MLKEESVRPRKVRTVNWLLASTRRRFGREHTGQEAVKLYQELEVDIVALGGSAVRAPDVVAVEIDTCKVKPRQPFDSSMLKNGQRCLAGTRWCLDRREKHKASLYSHTEADLKSFTYPWRRLSL